MQRRDELSAFVNSVMISGSVVNGFWSSKQDVRQLCMESDQTTHSRKTQFPKNMVVSEKSGHGEKALRTDFVFGEIQFGEALPTLATSWGVQKFE